MNKNEFNDLADRSIELKQQKREEKAITCNNMRTQNKSEPCDRREHTPTPWIIGQNVHGGWTTSGTHTKADAEFIVRAVNNHENLLEAIKGTLGAIQAKMDVVKGADKEWHLVRDLLKNAISKVEEK